MKAWAPKKYRDSKPTMIDFVGGLAFGVGLLILFVVGLSL